MKPIVIEYEELSTFIQAANRGLAVIYLDDTSLQTSDTLWFLENKPSQTPVVSKFQTNTHAWKREWADRDFPVRASLEGL